MHLRLDDEEDCGNIWMNKMQVEIQRTRCLLTGLFPSYVDEAKQMLLHKDKETYYYQSSNIYLIF